jgi:zinc protease
MLRSLVFLLLAPVLLPAEPPKVFPFPYRQEDLPNGLRLITVTTEYPNVVALYIAVSTGSRNEVEPGKTGFAHLFEHMMFRGTEKVSPEQYQQMIQQAGADSNAYTSDDMTVYHTVLSREDLDRMLMLEADRFQHLKYPPDVLKTESLAVLGEYNKNSANPVSKLHEVMRETAFDRHTYRHTTMGYLRDVQAMPEQYDYSLRFFDRFYRPEYTTIIVAGDVKPADVRPLVNKYWGSWPRGSYRPEIPPEPAQTAPRENHIDWPTPTLPWLAIDFRAPGYTDTGKDTAALSALGFLAFSENSELYRKLVVKEQKVDALGAGDANHVDPYLFQILARIKKNEDISYVREQVLSTITRFRDELVTKDRLEAVKSHLRYRFSLQMDNNQSIAESVARVIPLRRTPETINRLFAVYASLTPEDIRDAARKYLVPSGRTIVTLTGKGAAR